MPLGINAKVDFVKVVDVAPKNALISVIAFISKSVDKGNWVAVLINNAPFVFVPDRIILSIVPVDGVFHDAKTNEVHLNVDLILFH